MRLVGKYSLYSRTEQIAAFFIILFVRALNKQLGNLAVHRVYVRKAVVKIRTLLFFLGKHRVTVSLFYLAFALNRVTVRKPLFAAFVRFQPNGITVQNTRNLFAGNRLLVAVVQRQKPQAIFPVFRNHAAARAARPAVLVVQPRFHAVLIIRILCAYTHKSKPLVAQIFGNKSRARVHKKSAEPHIVHTVDLAQKLAFFKLAVPRPKRFAAIRIRRIFQCFYNFHSNIINNSIF